MKQILSYSVFCSDTFHNSPFQQLLLVLFFWFNGLTIWSIHQTYVNGLGQKHMLLFFLFFLAKNALSQPIEAMIGINRESKKSFAQF